MGVLGHVEYKSVDLVHGQIGIKVLSSCLLSYNQLEAARRVISRSLKRKGKVVICVRGDTLLTKKPVGIRMGKGKGKGSEWVCKVKAGAVVLEVVTDSLSTGLAALKRASKKLPAQVSIVSHTI